MTKQTSASQPLMPPTILNESEAENPLPFNTMRVEVPVANGGSLETPMTLVSDCGM